MHHYVDLNHPTKTKATCLPKNKNQCLHWFVELKVYILIQGNLPQPGLCRCPLSSRPAWLRHTDISACTQTFSSWVCWYITDVSEFQHNFINRKHRFCSAGQVSWVLSIVLFLHIFQHSHKCRISKGSKNWKDTICVKCIPFKARARGIHSTYYQNYLSCSS